LEADWTRGIGVEHECISVVAIIIPVVGSLDQQGKCFTLDLITHVDQGFSEGTTSILGALSHEFDVPALGLQALLPKEVQVVIATLGLLERLSKDGIDSFIVYLAGV
jgi:hypothetical protein